MLGQQRPYAPHKIIVREWTAVAPKVSFAVQVPYHRFDYNGMDVESAAAGLPVLKKPFLFDLDVLRAIFERVQTPDERLMSFLLPTTRPTRLVAARKWSDVTWVHVALDSEIGMGPNGARITDTQTLHFEFYGRGGMPDTIGSWPIVHVTLRVDDMSQCLRIGEVVRGGPFVRPARVKLQAVLRRVLKVRPYALHWLETYERAVCAPGGKGRQRDLEAFEDDFGA